MSAAACKLLLCTQKTVTAGIEAENVAELVANGMVVIPDQAVLDAVAKYEQAIKDIESVTDFVESYVDQEVRS